MHPLGLCYIGAMLLRHDCSVTIFDNCVHEKPVGDEVKEVLAFQPDVVGFYATTMGFNAACQIAKGVKAADPNIKTVLGGPHATALPTLTVEKEEIDFAVFGEGEHTMVELVKAIEDGGGYSAIPGLAYKDGEGPHQNASRTAPQNMDDFPFPARHLLPPLTLYRPAAIYWRRLPSVHIFTSRGCPFACTFCQSSRLASGNIFGKKVRSHSVEYSVEEIDRLVKDFGVKEILINDDTFNVSKKRVYAFCEAIMKRGLHKKIEWTCNIQVSTPIIEAPLFKAMKKAGCWQVMPGIESGSQQILDMIKKGITLEEAERAVRLAKEAGLVIKANFILGHPTETKETIEETVRFAKRIRAHFASVTLMSPLPGTELYDSAKDFGHFDPFDFDSVAFAGGTDKVPFVPEGLTAEYLVETMHRVYRELYLHPRTVMMNLATVRSFEGLKTYWDALGTLLKSQGIPWFVGPLARLSRGKDGR